jgi:hypothetical protein
MSKHLNQLLKWLSQINPNLVFLFMLVVFFIDSAVNYFANIPIFVPVAMLLLPVLWISLWRSGRKNVFLLLFVFVFILISVINNFIYHFDKRNISDLVFILLFATSYYFYKIRPEKLWPQTIHTFFIVTLLMFSFTFVGVNSDSFLRKSVVEGVQQDTLNQSPPPDISTRDEKIFERKANKLDVLEILRTYHHGLFRVPHLVTCFMGFFFLFYGFMFQAQRKWYFLLAMIISLVFMLYSGSRTFLVAAFLALILYLLRRKTVIYLLIIGLVLSLMIYYRYEVFHLLENTFLGQYAGFSITVVDNFSRLSRAMLWNSWWFEMQHFAGYDFLIGKTLSGSMEANSQNIHFREWFHNDFLSITYAYGLIALLMYITFFYKMFRENVRFIRANVYLFVFFFTMIFSAIFNGFYYYFPVFLIFIFIYMIRVEKKALKQ